MPEKKMRKAAPAQAGEASAVPVPEGWLEHVVTGPMNAGALDEVMRGIKKALIERVLQAEMSHHLGYRSGEAKPQEGHAAGNHRNGRSGKTVLAEDGPLRIDVPRDRGGTFEPQLIGKHEQRFTGFDDKILGMYARGMSVREIQGFLAQMYRVEVRRETGKADPVRRPRHSLKADLLKDRLFSPIEPGVLQAGAERGETITFILAESNSAILDERPSLLTGNHIAQNTVRFNGRGVDKRKPCLVLDERHGEARYVVFEDAGLHVDADT